MRLPSSKTLARVFANPALARSILEMSHAELAAHPAGDARIKECYHHPKWFDVRMTVLDSIEPASHGLEGALVSGIGIGMHEEEWVNYLNTGEMYADTLIYWNGRYRVQSLGDFIERHQK